MEIFFCKAHISLIFYLMVFDLSCFQPTLPLEQFNSITSINPLPHGRKTPPTPRRRVYKTSSNDDCSGHIRPRPCKLPSTCVWSFVCVKGSAERGAPWRYSIFIWECQRKGPLKIFNLHRESTRAVTCGRDPCRKVKPERGGPRNIYFPKHSLYEGGWMN